MIRSSRQGFYPHGKSDWIAAVKKLHKQRRSVFAGDLQDKHPYLYNQGVWIFGDWDKALRAAGFDPKRMRLRTFWDKRKIIDELQRMQKQSLPLYPNYVMKNHQKLFSGALRQYGVWNKALIAAGMINQEVPRKLYNSRLAILRALRDSLERRSKDDIPQALRLRAAHYFGSLRNALLTLRKDQRFLRGWSKQKIVLTLSRMHRSKESLAHARIRREIPALLSAAEAYFGSWGRALYAAGIDPNLYFVRRRWRGPKVRESIAGVPRRQTIVVQT